MPASTRESPDNDGPSTAPTLPDGLRLAAAYLLAGAGLALLVLVLMGWDGLARPWLLACDTVAALVIGFAVLWARHRQVRVPLAVQYGIALAGIGLISGTSFAIGGTEGAVFACSYAFALAICAMHYPLRDVMVLLALVAAMYAGVVLADGGTVTQWVLVVGVAAASGLLAGRFHRHVRRLTSRLQHLESWRSMLMSSLAHDLRSPLGMADSTLQLLQTRAEDLSDDQRRELLEAARRHQRRAIQLTRDLLDHERVHAGALQLELRPTALRDAVATACEFVPTEVTIDVPDDLVVDADPGRLQQIVVNLVSNAAKYGGSSSPVEVGAAEVDGQVRCWVRDRGPGLSADQRTTVFTRFGAGDTADSVGLGLWIVERLVQAHGGEIIYEDAAPGARFTWTLQPTAHPLAERHGS